MLIAVGGGGWVPTVWKCEPLPPGSLPEGMGVAQIAVSPTADIERLLISSES
jgi:hypothetical protein